MSLLDRAKQYTAHKYLGQNFLISENFVSKIADSINPIVNNILEIGPGLGFLTEELLKRDFKIWAVDLDQAALNRIPEHENLVKIHQDILNFDFNLIPKPFSVIGNLPFHIGGKILTNITGEINETSWNIQGITEMVLMFQLEVADRITAQPKTKAYNQLSILMNAKTNREFLFKVPSEYFYPKPKVHAGVIKLVPAENILIKDLNAEEKINLKQIIRAAFQMRRKTIRNSVAQFLTEEQIINAGINPKLRAEELSLGDFITLLRSIPD